MAITLTVTQGNYQLTANTDSNSGDKKAALEKRLLDNKQKIVFFEWLHDRQQAAGLEFQKG